MEGMSTLRMLMIQVMLSGISLHSANCSVLVDSLNFMNVGSSYVLISNII
jgi:hypothetical protein